MSYALDDREERMYRDAERFIDDLEITSYRDLIDKGTNFGHDFMAVVRANPTHFIAYMQR